MTHWPILLEFTALALAIGVCGYFLSLYGDVIAEKTGLGGTWVGFALLATVTSLPEVAVTLSALRIGALDMAISDLFGSNLFDLLIVAVDDLAYRRGPLLSDVSTVHLVSAQSAIMMTGIAIVGLLYRPKTRLFKTVGWASLFMFSIYILNMSVLYLQRE